ncbi:MAG: 5-aminolevulinic acid synthase [Alphaproteobacteria bacterium 16-39-46]|nr:MAG: 5-aminolevulinic acid synthase [Alphaproteobacteria bacterium 16-39-46]OZA43024.1 MAG: 5-aminolevulinic acid synthase [Alphaproteobacteria bacterium 17-39-52]HQS84133.1 5-aminolevulinate synthase [Alphaproteobacteria bacterium]HQS94003.1 5-aminolevulinate synthase [Alphaproteobacteria bacterium]
MNYNHFLEEALEAWKTSGNYRYFAHIERLYGRFPVALYHTPDARLPPQEVIVWCSNDYLGMGQNPDVLDAVQKNFAKGGTGAGGTRNISGTTPSHQRLETGLSELHQKDASLICTSGYVANEAALGTLGAKLPNCVIFSDECNHASMIQGIRLSRAEKHIFKHNCPKDLRRLLADAHAQDPHRPKIITFESVYSMDGDIAPIEEFCDLAKEYNALTFIDEVHAIGLYGKHGGGITEELGLQDRVDLISGTFGKAFGLVGGYLSGSFLLIDFIRSFASSFIFTTALPPAIMAGAYASLHYLKNHPELRESHQRNVKTVKEGLENLGVPLLLNQSHIVPVIVGDAHLCRTAATYLLKHHNIYVQPINYPTVPIGTERFRITPSPLHTPQMITDLLESINDTWNTFSLKRFPQARKAYA